MLVPEDVVDDGMFQASLERLRGLCPDETKSIYHPKGMVWAVYRYTCCLWGGLRAGLLQLAMPEVACAIQNHSEISKDPYARLRRTLLFVSQANYGPSKISFQLAKSLRQYHTTIRGIMPDGRPYHANSEKALFWVHATLVDTAVTMFELLKRPLSLAEKNDLIRENYKSALLMGLYNEKHHQSWDAFQSRYQDLCLNHTSVTAAAKNQARCLMDAPFPFAPVMNRLRSLTRELLPRRFQELCDTDIKYPSSDSLRAFLKIYYRFAPEAMQWMPPYYEAVCYYQGKTSQNPLVLAGNKIMSGKIRVFPGLSEKG